MNDKEEIEGTEGTEEAQASFRDAVQEKVTYQIGADKTQPDLHVTFGDGIGIDAETSLPKGFDRLVFKPETGYGLLYKSPVEVEKREVFIYRGKEVSFMDYWPNFKIIRACYTKLGINANEVITLPIPIGKIPASILKNMEVWTVLEGKFKEELEKIPETSTIESVDKMGHVRKFRKARADYDGVARSVTCCKCQTPQKINPALVLKRAEKAGVNHIDWAKDFLCQKCHPTKGRGRKVSSKWALLPKSLKCSHPGCDFVQKQHPSMTEKMAKAKGIGFNEYVETWKCKIHREKKPHPMSAEGRALRGMRAKAVNPLFANIPKNVICTGCKKPITLVPAQALEKSKILGLTMEEFLKTFKCKSCGGRITKAQKLAYKKRLKKEAKAAKAGK